MSSARRYRLRKDELKRVEKEIKARFGEDVLNALGKTADVIELDAGLELIAFDDGVFFQRAKGELLPTLKSINMIKLPTVVVDMGAVPHVVNGADVMGPGVVSADPKIREGDIVVITDERHGKAIAVGMALVGGDRIKAPSGRVVKNLHHVGDRAWRFLDKG